MAPNQTTHQRILEAALEVFLEHGWQSSLDTIAERAGVARQTLYNHFPSKEALFAEAGKACSASLAVTLEDDQGSLRERLIAFSRAFRAKVMSEQGLAMCRMMIAEAPRFPDLTKMMFDAGPGATRKRLAAVLAGAMEKNEIKKDDPDFAAEILLALLGGFSRTEKLCTNFSETEAENEKSVQRIVDIFLRAFAK
jgi:TetR/AcrR family transcriptional repressor of mexJK operon